MTQRIERDAIYRRRRFPRDVIETCVRWYLTYRLSYRDLVALMAERDVHLTHATIMRWVFRFVPEYEKRWNRRAKPVGSSWRVDETFIHTRPKMGYLYPCRRQGRKDRRLTVPDRAWNCGGDGFLPQGAGVMRTPIAAQDNSGWAEAQSFGSAQAPSRGLSVEIRPRAKEPLTEQRRRARSPGY